MNTRLVEKVFEVQAVKINCTKPFLWASGYYMPIYTDNRLLVGSFEGRKLITELFSQIVSGCDYIAGTATAGIAPAASLADKLEKPLIYVRSKAKDHGAENLIEGISAEQSLSGKKVALIEDAVSTGGSSLKAVAALKARGADVPHVYAVYSYGFEKAHERFQGEGITLHALYTYRDLIEFAKERHTIDEADYAALLDWQKAPFEWGKKNGFEPVV